jgi:hypothetical protein
MLVQGLVQGIIGPGLAANLLGVAILAGFLVFWALTLAELER